MDNNETAIVTRSMCFVIEFCSTALVQILSYINKTYEFLCKRIIRIATNNISLLFLSDLLCQTCINTQIFFVQNVQCMVKTACIAQNDKCFPPIFPQIIGRTK